MKKRLIVGITGATGAIYGVQLLKTLSGLEDWESHVVMSDAGALNLWHELKMRRKDLEKLATAAYNPKDIGATIASGSFLTEGMVIAPCSMKTLAAVAHAHADDLVSRAADVVLKERRRLVLLPRETPLNLAHLRKDRKSTRLNSSHSQISYAVFCLKKKMFHVLRILNLLLDKIKKKPLSKSIVYNAICLSPFPLTEDFMFCFRIN